MKADILKAADRVNEAGEDVLARVLLHMVKSALIIDSALDLRADGALLGAAVNHFSALFVNVEYFCAADEAVIRRLTAALGEERGPVEHDLIAAAALNAGNDPRGEILYIDIIVVKPLCHITLPFLYDIVNNTT